MRRQCVGAAHRHPGFVLAYVLEGAVVAKISGQGEERVDVDDARSGARRVGYRTTIGGATVEPVASLGAS